MVKRYPHYACPEKSTSTVVDGELVSGNDAFYSIKGRFEDTLGSNSYVVGANGDNIQVKGKFFTQTKAMPDTEELIYNGTTFKIINWYDNQANSVIYLTT